MRPALIAAVLFAVVLSGGPDVALVQGRVKGQRVRSWLNRRNGCQIERWNALGTVLDV